MKASEAILQIKFQIRPSPTPEDPKRVEYKTLQTLLMEKWPKTTCNTFPLLFACPLFIDEEGHPDHDSEATRIVVCILPPHTLPRKAGIYFLCNALEKLAVKDRMSERSIAKLVRRIEKQFELRGMDYEGRTH